MRHVAIVTGANHGIGAATATALARRGCAVLVSYLRVHDAEDPGTPGMLFDAAEAEFGPADILVNNATGWLADTFQAAGPDRLGRTLRPVTAATWRRQFSVDVMAAALLIAEFARRHVARGASWGRIIGLTSGGPLGFPEEVSYGAAKAAQENYTMSAAFELAPVRCDGQHGVPPGHRHRLG